MASSNASVDRFVVRAPNSAGEWEAYYALRYRLLRQPWNQPPGSERDELEPIAHHRIAIEQTTGRIVGCGRIHRREDGSAQIRYMAFEDGYRNLGIGSLLLESLEAWALDRGIGTIVLYARVPAVRFYQRHGYRIVAPGAPLFGSIEHVLMQKP